MNAYFTTGYELDKDAYATQLTSMYNPSAYEAEYWKRYFTKEVGEIRVVDRFFSMDKVIKTETPNWSEVVERYGGYAEVGKMGIKKGELKDNFTLTYTLKNLIITGDESAKALLTVSHGNKDAFSYYNISSDTITIDGKYLYPKITFVDIYKMAKYGNKENNL